MPTRIPPLAVTAYSATSALGRGVAAHAEALRAGHGGLRANDFSSAALECFIGRVEGVEDAPLPRSLSHWECRNNRLAWLGLNQDGMFADVQALIERYGAHRIALILGTSTASIGASEEAYRHLQDGRFPEELRRPGIHTPHSLTAFIAEATGIAGPSLTISTACSSSAKVFASAERMIRLGLADAALVGGVDTLCDSVLFGFNALELVSPEPCRPFDARRRGISIGEAAAFAVLQRVEADPAAPRLIGYGESSDAYHMSTPHPQGLGARAALDDTLARAGLKIDRVDYVNLHGTATLKNDEVEAALLG
ncbi:MAG TPA: beta-ketoacyl synthase N-terminal-like domain-containing protein, partial [Rhodanobacteraceae bacterium]|nr:beta-ketoacyl synthase N-terminal-like domain-containing protein [Rhodanobacteraceae bacterium]